MAHYRSKPFFDELQHVRYSNPAQEGQRATCSETHYSSHLTILLHKWILFIKDIHQSCWSNLSSFQDASSAAAGNGAFETLVTRQFRPNEGIHWALSASSKAASSLTKDTRRGRLRVLTWLRSLPWEALNDMAQAHHRLWLWNMETFSNHQECKTPLWISHFSSCSHAAHDSLDHLQFSSLLVTCKDPSGQAIHRL